MKEKFLLIFSAPKEKSEELAAILKSEKVIISLISFNNVCLQHFSIKCIQNNDGLNKINKICIIRQFTEYSNLYCI